MKTLSNRWYAFPLLLAAILVSYSGYTLLTNFNSVNRAGDPAGPGVSSSKNCTGCHSGIATVNNNTVMREFSLGNNLTAYIPGTQYTVTFKINAAGPVGFSATVLRNDSNTMAGSLMSDDTSQTKVVSHLASGRYYVNHRVGDVTSGSKTYTFKWTAPAAGTGPVTFYIGSLSSNNDQASTGDTTYINAYVITEGSATGFADLHSDAIEAIYPNPVSETLHINLKKAVHGQINARLVSLNGSRSYNLLNEYPATGATQLSIQIPALAKPGIYFLNLTGSDWNHIQKILVY